MPMFNHWCEQTQQRYCASLEKTRPGGPLHSLGEHPKSTWR